jgi:hypothetical protein
MKKTKLRKLIEAQKVKPLTREEYTKLRINIYKAVR